MVGVTEVLKDFGIVRFMREYDILENKVYYYFETDNFNDTLNRDHVELLYFKENMDENPDAMFDELLALILKNDNYDDLLYVNNSIYLIYDGKELTQILLEGMMIETRNDNTIKLIDCYFGFKPKQIFVKGVWYV